MQPAMLLAYIEKWVVELEREVAAFEAAVDKVEDVMDEVERFEEPGVPQDVHMRSLEQALEKADRHMELASAANITLNDALDAAEQLLTSTQPASMSPVSHAETHQLEDAQDGNRSAMSEQQPARRVIKAELISPKTSLDGIEPLPVGAIILNGRYRIVQVLHHRHRVYLYLGYRLPRQDETQPREDTQPTPVAIREIVLSGLPTETRTLIEKAAFEEFVAPAMFGSPRLPGVGDRIAVEYDRHYLVMQLRPTRGQRPAVALPLGDLLLTYRQWPGWLDMNLALEWSIQLCRIVARLHRMGIILGTLNPSTILADANGAAEWAPVLLVSWPPAPRFWPSSLQNEQAKQLYAKVFPLGKEAEENPFVAPEVLKGYCDERSDIYALGAVLYLLFTRYAPAAAHLRLLAEKQQSLQQEKPASGPLHVRSGPLPAEHEGMPLVPPHLFNPRISSRLEDILVRALALRPEDRYPQVFALVEALESIDPQTDCCDPYLSKLSTRRESRITKVLEWVRQELSE
ncbi:MAG TPA: hypothetical protein VFA41_10910 [Ktedonobacteraceae bacterium]|nr:hypothetical protein [Ktedonobacteraceae bacterium]